MKLHKDSHVDHGLTAKQLAHVLLMFEGRDAFFIETITLPPELGTVPCTLFGPIMGDPPIPSMLVEMKPRNGRAYSSRMLNKFVPVGTDYFKLVDRYVSSRREVNTVTVIAGPYLDTEPCVLYTVFGGPLAPKEPNDPTLTDDKRAESIAFWAEHALAEVV